MQIILTLKKLNAWLERFFKRKSKYSFVASLKASAKILDVGCGNNGPLLFKMLRPDLHYVGLDIGDYNQSIPPSRFADRYVLTTPAQFASEIGNFSGKMDAVISSHNLEHCDDPAAVLEHMLGALAPGGRMFLSFPCRASMQFPSRSGTLNFFDDPTHKSAPPDFAAICALIEKRGFALDFAAEHYRPAPFLIAGFLLEPVSRLFKQVLPGTWALYGFEAIIWVSRGSS